MPRDIVLLYSSHQMVVQYYVNITSTNDYNTTLFKVNNMHICNVMQGIFKMSEQNHVHQILQVHNLKLIFIHYVEIS